MVISPIPFFERVKKIYTRLSWSDHKRKLGEIGRKLFFFFVSFLRVLIKKYQRYNYL